MADAGLFIGWGEVVRGREVEAVENFSATLEYFAGLQSDGTIESFEPVLLEPHGGDLDGFIFVRGDAEKLAALRVDEDFQDILVRAGLIVDRLGVVGAAMGARLEHQMGSYTAAIATFA
ncbi:MAG: hypothetical protein OEW52_08060 [Thermoleophilia bacterium]|nr:hypothetical protein [Thermoleophilia bacterium]MDH4339633.1 hypothetical protein [Thermoleophilia bacterium]MDH5281088.1 hypothetical protein [Thermoleophilia bacterium]